MSECPLTQLSPGEAGKVQRVEGEGVVRHRLQEMGLVRGTRLQFIRSAPLGDPIEIRVRGYHLTLRKQEADAVIVVREEG